MCTMGSCSPYLPSGAASLNTLSRFVQHWSMANVRYSELTTRRLRFPPLQHEHSPVIIEPVFGGEHERRYSVSFEDSKTSIDPVQAGRNRGDRTACD